MSTGRWPMGLSEMTLWRHAMEAIPHHWTFIWGIYWPRTDSPHKGPVMRCALVFYWLLPGMMLNKQPSCWWVEGTWCRCNDVGEYYRIASQPHCDDIFMGTRYALFLTTSVKINERDIALCHQQLSGLSNGTIHNINALNIDLSFKIKYSLLSFSSKSLHISIHLLPTTKIAFWTV